jgi:hypothetical protein
MSKKNQNTPKNPKNTAEQKKTGFFATLGHVLFSAGKVVGIVMAIACVVSLIAIPFSSANENRSAKSDTYVITEFRTEDNVVVMENGEGVCEVSPLGIVLNPEADFTKYLGTEVYLKRDSKMGSKREDGMMQRHIIVLHTEHVLQLDMMIDGVADYTGLQVGSSWYYMYRDCDAYGVYPES